MAMAPSVARAYRRTLHIIRALQRGPLDRQALQALVRESEGEDAYGAATARAAQKAFEEDLKRAREQLGVTIRYNRTLAAYEIADIEATGWLDLSDETLEALSIVFHTFDAEAPHAARVRRALDELLAWLPAARRQQVMQQRPGLALELRDLDREAPPQIIDTVRQAIERRRVLGFIYLSPRYDDQRPRRVEMEPHELAHEEGHWYLRGHVRAMQTPTGWIYPARARRFRVSYIQAEGLEIRPEKLPLTPRPRRTFQIRYRLHPDLARGHISARFDDTTVCLLDDGWAEVTATAHDEFHVAQTLFRYADKCVVLEPPEVVEMVRAWLWGMLKLYEESREGEDGGS